MNYTLLLGDNRETLKTIADCSVDSVVTDPPYGIDFLGRAWDATTGTVETYRECLRILKPGGHILAFSAPRTYHHLARLIEEAGFEIRDQIMWIYGSGMPKSQDIGRHPGMEQWSGWGTALKPAHEPICMARRPVEQSIHQTVARWGTGALNIKAARIPIEGPDTRSGGADGWDRVEFGQAQPRRSDGQPYQPDAAGRFPSNVIGSIPDYQPYFYCPKVSRQERHVGYDLSSVPVNNFNSPDQVRHHPLWDESIGTSVSRLQDKIRRSQPPGNNHPTVKPVALMRYLIQLVTPPGGHVVDPYMGSGSTGMAAVELGHSFTGCELDPDYLATADRRIRAWNEPSNQFDRLFEHKDES